LISGIFVFFFLPELKGRSLEELDYMFEAHIPTRQFKAYDTTSMLEEKRREHGHAELGGASDPLNEKVEKNGEIGHVDYQA
jgi:SP family sugar:H+ symporter-like MFS transporter